MAVSEKFWPSLDDLFYYTRSFSKHTASTIVALIPTRFQGYLRAQQYDSYSGYYGATLKIWNFIKSQEAFMIIKDSSTHLRQNVSCSLLEVSVYSSQIIEK